jgi:CheY-like chemotaxis protein
MSSDTSQSAIGLLLSDDMMFTSRIAGTARDLGLNLQSVTTVEALLSRARQENPSCVIVDLSNRTLDTASLVGKLRESCTPMPRIVAYGSHVDAKSLHAAREAGCDVVLPRSKFVEELPKQLPQWLRRG